MNQFKRLLHKEINVYKKITGGDICPVGTRKEFDSLVSKGINKAIWIVWEFLLVKEMNDEEVRAIHQIKKIFPGTILSPKT